MSGKLGGGGSGTKKGIPIDLEGGGVRKRRTYTLPSGIKRKSDEVSEAYDSDESDTSEDGDWAPPPPRKRTPESGLRVAPRAAPPQYWDHAAHAAACRKEGVMLAGQEGVGLEDIDASEGEGASIASEEDDEASEEDDGAEGDDAEGSDSAEEAPESEGEDHDEKDA